MRIGKALTVAATLGLVAAPLQAASVGIERQSTAVEGENLAGGGISDTVLIAGLIVALGALVYVAADDESEDLPASP